MEWSFQNKWNALIFEHMDSFQHRDALSQLLATRCAYAVRIVMQSTVLFDNTLSEKCQGRGEKVLIIRKHKNAITWKFEEKPFNDLLHQHTRCLFISILKQIKKCVTDEQTSNGIEKIAQTFTSHQDLRDEFCTHLETLLEGKLGQLAKKYFGWIEVVNHRESFTNLAMHQNTSEMHSSMLFRTRVPNSVAVRTLQIHIWPRHNASKHPSCFTVRARKLRKIQVEDGQDVCECCALPLESFAMASHFSSKAKVSTITEMMPHMRNREQLKWMFSQHDLIQYAVQKNGTISYFDMCEGQMFQQACENWDNVLTTAKKRMKKMSLKKRSLLRNFQTKAVDMDKQQWESDLNAITTTTLLFVFGLEEHDWELLDVACTTFAKGARVTKKCNLEKRSQQGYSWKQWRVVNGSDLISSTTESLTETACCQEMKFFFDFMREKFHLEILSGLFFSLPCLSLTGILYLASQSSPLYVAPAKPPIGLYELLKKTAKYQLLYNSIPEIYSGERMSPHHETLKSCLQIDITSCYAYQAASQSFPTGQPVIFHGGNQENNFTLEKSHKGLPHRTGEFRVIYYACYQMSQRKDIVISKIYSRYHGGTQWQVNKLSLDLLIVYRDVNATKCSNPKYFALNVHHNYTHTCPDPTCPKPRKYARNLSEKALGEYSNTIDEFWRHYCQYILDCPYITVYTCHKTSMHSDFAGYGAILRAFSTAPELKRLVHFGLAENRHLLWSELQEMSKQPNNYVILIVAEGGQAENNVGQPGHVISRRHGKTIMSNKTHSPTLFHANYLNYLIQEKKFVLTKVHHAIVYLASNSHAPIFQKLVKMRSEPGADPKFMNFLKSCLNWAIGVMATTKTEKSRISLHSRKFKPTSWHSVYDFEALPGDILQVTRHYEQSDPSHGILFPWHVTLLEHYRLRMVETLKAMEDTFVNSLYRVIQIQTDSFVILLGKPCMKACAKDEKAYHEVWRKSFMKRSKCPGFFNIQKSAMEGNFKIETRGVRMFNIKLNRTKQFSRPFNILSSYTNAYCQFVEMYDDHLPYCVPFE